MIFGIDPGQELEIFKKYFLAPASGASRRRSGGTPPPGWPRGNICSKIHALLTGGTRGEQLMR